MSMSASFYSGPIDKSDGLESAQSAFLAHYTRYSSTRQLDELRASEYGRLDQAGHVYLDYTGGSLYAESQVQEHQKMLLANVFGNPHSTNPTSQAATILIQNTRAAILSYFHASPDEYDVVFTQNASGALKLVGESYPFDPGGRFLLTFDNHNSVNGIREYAHARGASVTYAPVLPPNLKIDAMRLDTELGRVTADHHNLFAYPAQSNFSGVQHSLEWVARAQTRGWDVLLDCAAYAPTNALDLCLIHPDFVPISFYKLFGYPTGVGCLLARKEALAKLHRPWFAGGTITVASVQGNRYYLHEGAEGFEDGTLNYLSIPAVEIGLRHIARAGLDSIHQRVMSLTSWLLSELSQLQHMNGVALAHLYGPNSTQDRGGTVAFNFYDPDGHFIDQRVVEHLANQVNISLRTGCFCNPGAGEMALGLSAEQLSSCFVKSIDRFTLDEFRRCIDDRSTGAVRVSLGLVTNFSDVYRFIQFARQFLNRPADDLLTTLS